MKQQGKGTYTRGYLPHRDYPGQIQFITIRLWDSLPAEVLDSLEREYPDPLRRSVRLQDLLDAGRGSCLLEQPAVYAIVEETLFWLDEHDKCDLFEWVIMPNHVHLIARIHVTLKRFVSSLKSFTTLEINRLMDREGALWMKGYFDRMIRDERHFARVRYYLRQNPVKAGLVESEDEWPPWRS